MFRMLSTWESWCASGTDHFRTWIEVWKIKNRNFLFGILSLGQNWKHLTWKKNKLSFSVKSNLIFTMKWWSKKVQMKRSVHAAVLSQGISYKLLAFSHTWDCNIKIFQSGNLKFLPQMGNRILRQQGGPHYEAVILNFLSM